MQVEFFGPLRPGISRVSNRRHPSRILVGTGGRVHRRRGFLGLFAATPILPRMRERRSDDGPSSRRCRRFSENCSEVTGDLLVGDRYFPLPPRVDRPRRDRGLLARVFSSCRRPDPLLGRDLAGERRSPSQLLLRSQRRLVRPSRAAAQRGGTSGSVPGEITTAYDEGRGRAKCGSSCSRARRLRLRADQGCTPDNGGGTVSSRPSGSTNFAHVFRYNDELYLRSTRRQLPPASKVVRADFLTSRPQDEQWATGPRLHSLTNGALLPFPSQLC